MVYAVDHLVNNAGVMSVSTLEEAGDVTDFKAIMVRPKAKIRVQLKFEILFFFCQLDRFMHGPDFQ